MSTDNNKATQQGSLVAQNAMKAAEQLNKSVATFQTMVDSIPAWEEKIQGLMDREKNLQTVIAEKERTANLDLELRLRENEVNAVNKILSSRGRTSILNSEVEEYKALEKDFKTQVDKSVAAAVSNATRTHQQELNAKELTFKAEQAQNEAKINSLEETLQRMETQIESLENIITKEREARVQEAQARGNAMVTVQTQK
jgi:vacuolar-type H+-ATPase subunit I/STV1